MQNKGARSSRTLTLYRDDSTAQVRYERVKSYFFTANNTVLTISRYDAEEGDGHHYIHWPRERFCWFKDEPIGHRPTSGQDRPMNDLVTRIKQLKAERKHYFDVEGDGVDTVLNDCWDEIEKLRAALEKCRDKFREYEQQHAAKAQQIFDDGKTQGLLNAERMAMQARLTKAATNRDMAEMCDAALNTLIEERANSND